ncbi:hypothetical protein Aperf_G00000103201 [Anoplocephala perfoliata]
MSEAWSKSSSNIRAYDFEEMHLNQGPYEHPPSSSGTRLTEQYAISKNSSQPEQTPSRGPSGGYAFAQRTLNQGEWPKQQTHAISNAPDQQLRAAIPGGFAQPQSIATDYTQHQNFIISEAPETKHRSYGASMDPQSSQMPSNTVFQPTLQTRPHISFRSGGSLTELPRTQPLSTAPLWSQQSRMPILENPNRQLELRDPSIADSISARRSLKRKWSDESESEKQSVAENIPRSESKSTVKTPSEETGNQKYPGSVRNIRMANPDEVINVVLDDLQRINQTGPTGLPTNDPVAQSFSSPALLTTSASDSSNRLLNSPRLTEATLTPSGNDLASQSSAKGATQSDSTESNLLQSHNTGNYKNLVADSYNNPDADLEMNPTAQIFEAKLKDLEKNNHSHTNNTLSVTSEIPIPQDVLEFVLEKMADSP